MIYRCEKSFSRKKPQVDKLFIYSIEWKGMHLNQVLYVVVGKPCPCTENA